MVHGTRVASTVGFRAYFADRQLGHHGGVGEENQEAKKKKKRVKITRDWSYCISVAMQRRDCTRTKGEKEVSAGRVGGEGVLRVHVRISARRATAAATSASASAAAHRRAELFCQPAHPEGSAGKVVPRQ
jgi:hypothetical protein